jgi:hypothetical protein
MTTPAPIILDADAVFTRSGLPYWAIAQFRQMRAGDELSLVDFMAPGVCASTGQVSVTIRRERGYFRLDAGWTAHLGKNAQRRGHLWTWVHFKLLPNRKIELIQIGGIPGIDVRLHALRLVKVVLRRANLLSAWAKRDGDKDAFAAMALVFFRNRQETDDGAEQWLERLRGPELVRTASEPDLE